MVNLRWSVSTPRNFLAAAANASSSVSGSFSTSFGAFGSGAASSPVSQMSKIFLAILYLLPVPSKTCVESSTCASILGVLRFAGGAALWIRSRVPLGGRVRVWASQRTADANNYWLISTQSNTTKDRSDSVSDWSSSIISGCFSRSSIRRTAYVSARPTMLPLCLSFDASFNLKGSSSTPISCKNCSR